MYRLVDWEDKAKWIICQPPLYTSPCKKKKNYNHKNHHRLYPHNNHHDNNHHASPSLYLTKNHTYIYLGRESCLGLFPGMIRQLRSRLSLSVWLSTWEATAVLPYMAGRGCISCPTLFFPPPDYSPVRATARAPVQGGTQFRASPAGLWC